MTLTTSRRDDMISLCYLMVYMIDDYLDFLEDLEEFEKIMEKKENLTTGILCQSNQS